jgi:LacI family repressor for deo operon, udp, cdd, tsx, nupC, and nupG
MTRSAYRRPTGHDVADAAGVSQSTVSLVFSGKALGRVSAAAEERVRRAAQELGYRPHASASILRAGRARAVGLVVPDVTNPFLGRVLRGAQQEARPERYTVALIEPGEERDWQLTAMESLNAAAIDGMLLFAIDPPRDAHPDRLGPIVLLEASCPGFSTINLDVEAGTRAAVQHLLDLGHRRIGRLGVDLPRETFRVRGECWRRCVLDAGIERPNAPELVCGFDLNAARGAAHQLLQSAFRPTAVFCDDDLLAAGTMLAAHDLGISVPGQLSIMGFAGTILSEVATPQISTVMAHAETLGSLGMRALLDAIRGAPPRSEVVPMALTPRASTARPPDLEA